MGCFFLASAGLAGDGSCEESRSCVLQQGLGTVSAAGEGAVTSPSLNIECVCGAGASVPLGMSFPEEQHHLMFLELGLQADLGMIPYWHEIESMQDVGAV